jgi:hypothetical protein
MDFKNLYKQEVLKNQMLVNELENIVEGRCIEDILGFKSLVSEAMRNKGKSIYVSANLIVELYEELERIEVFTTSERSCPYCGEESCDCDML